MPNPAAKIKMSGLTLIEVIISIGLLLIISGLGLTVGFDFYKTFALDSEQAVLISVLRAARNSSINNLNQTPQGIFIGSNNYTLFQGNSYATRDQQFDQKFTIAPSLSLSGLTEVVFAQLSGNSSQSGTITLNATGNARTITINSAGGINW